MKSGLPKVVIDARMAGPALGGVGRYATLNAKGLAERSKLDYEPVFLCQPGQQDRFSGFTAIEVRTPYLDVREVLTIPAILFRTRAKLYHATSFSSLISLPCPWMVTIHDLVHQQSGNPFEKMFDETIFRTFVDRAKKVLTVSEFSKREIERWNGKLKPEVVLNALDPIFLKESPPVEPLLERYGLVRGKYWVCLSNSKPHKNVGLAVRAFLAARERQLIGMDWRLVLSLNSFSTEPGVVSAGPLSDAESIPLLRASAGLIFPSLYEGFGLPVLEAGVLGVPLLISDILPHREVFRGVSSSEVLFRDPHSVEPWVDALVQTSRGRVRSLSQSSRATLTERHSVVSFGAQLDRVYRDVLGIKE